MSNIRRFDGGTFPLQKNVFVLMYSETIDARLAPVDSKTLKLYFEINLGSEKGKKIPIPEDIEVYDSEKTKAEQHNEEFIILFHRDYLIRCSEGAEMKINSKMWWPESIPFEKFYDVSFWLNISSMHLHTESKESLDELSIFPLVEDIVNFTDRTGETYKKSWDIFRSYNIPKFKEDLKTKWHNKQEMVQHMWNILIDPRIYSTEEVCWAVYLKTTQSYL